ncbi:MAG: sel1 repeat family protein [Hyphococcus sp.]
MTMTMGAHAPGIANPIIEPDLSGEDMYRLGLQASTGGEGGDLDLVTAHKWFNLAAMKGNLEAREYRAELANEMTPEEIAEAQRQARAYLSTHREKHHA